MTEQAWKDGDVVRYTPEHGTHCRESIAIAEMDTDGTLVFRDTFWSFQMSRLSKAELASATFKFNLRDFEAVTGEREWARYASVDRAYITHQHGLQTDWLVRKGAGPDRGVQIENARRAVDAAERSVDAAQSQLDACRVELMLLEDAKEQAASLAA